jgi:putative colanic acid biosynthesis UDP-glucose lipid carrier transferase
MEQGYAITSLERPSMPRRGPAYSLQKRFLDVAGSLGLLIFLAPTLLLIALAVKLDSRGPILFVQRRTGLNGVPFRVYKFRSMTVADDGDVVKQATRNDSRVTRVGRFLRRSSLDELPQLLNVLKGDMSLVGPRPHALAHDEYYGSNIADYHKRFRARPGITGLSQVKGFRGETETVADMEQRIRFDNLYIESWSILKDIWILVSTAVIVPLQRTAY